MNVDDLDRMQAEINDEIRILQTLLRRKGYQGGRVEIAFNWIGYPVWVGVGLTKRLSSDQQFYGETEDGHRSLARALQQTRKFIEGLVNHVQWTPELVGRTLGLEPNPVAPKETDAIT
jgi:hypothetical protein